MDSFVVGLACGLAVAVIVSAIMMFKVSDEKKKAKEEIEKYKKLLADKMEVEAEGIRKLKDENEKLKEANKNLEVEIRVLSEKSDKRDSRTLQIVRRALESLMTENPEFAQVWQDAYRKSEEAASGGFWTRFIPQRKKIAEAESQRIPDDE